METLARLKARDECLLGKTRRVSEVDLANSGDPVIHPAYYQGNGYEVLDIIEDFELNFNLGSALKYILRAGKKNPELKKEDLEKALVYIKREANID
tara:strand:+ start:2775 stop:3062 length:288 start_codon:yes stop_codon:yes gene_type:complete